MQSAKHSIARLKILLNMLNSMKKIKIKTESLFLLIPLYVVGIMVAALASGILLGFILLNAIAFFTDEDTFGPVETKIHKDCYIENLDDDFQRIYYYPQGDKKQKKFIVEEWEDVKKYATNGKDTVAFHCIYDNSTYEDKFVIFNTAEEKEFTFDTQKEFADFCREEHIIFSDWKRGDHKPCEIINLGGDWTLYDFDDNFSTDQILNGYEVVYEGHVSGVTEDKNGIVNFRLIVPYYNDFEFACSNEGLDVKEEAIGELKCEFLTTMEICYDEILVLDTMTDKVKVRGDGA